MNFFDKIKRALGSKKSPDQRPKQNQREALVAFFSVPPFPSHMNSAACSDNACPCPETAIPRGKGYLYVSKELVEFRAKFTDMEDAKTELIRSGWAPDKQRRLFSPVIVCKQGAKLRGLDLAVAAEDAKRWWECGEVPLRATPKAGESEERSEKPANAGDVSRTEARPPGDAGQAYQTGAGFAQSEQWDKAASEFRQAVQLEPRSAPCRFSFAIALSKNTPSGIDEKELEKYVSSVSAEFDRAMTLGEQYGGLEPKHFQKAAVYCGTMHRIAKRHDEALRYFRWGLKYTPDDADLLSGKAVVLIELEKYNEAEQIAERQLEHNSNNTEARTVWKKARKGQGKGFEIDRPESERQQIYREYEGTKEGEFLQPDVAAAFKNAKGLAEMGKLLQEKGNASSEASRERILEKYNLKSFELDFILEEAKKKNWTFESVASRATQTAPQEASYRDSLTCHSCGKRNTAPFWPTNGNSVAFYYQSEAETHKARGAFRLPIACPFCKKTWYVVWDQSPDPEGAGQFLHHLERVTENYSDDSDATSQLYGQIHDKILGRYIQFILGGMAECLSSSTIKSDTFVFQDYYNVITLVPTLDHDAVRRYLGQPYTMFLDTVSSNWDKQNQFFAHWIFACDGTNANLHLCFLPKLSSRVKPMVMMPTDLLTPQEKQAMGMA